MSYNEMHPTFWSSLTLIYYNFETKSPFDLKQKHYKAEICNLLLSYNHSFSNRTKLKTVVEEVLKCHNTSFEI